MAIDPRITALTDAVAALRADLGEVQHLVGALPQLMADWRLNGSEPVRRLAISTHAGPDAMRGGWTELAGRGRPLVAVFPQPDELLGLPPDADGRAAGHRIIVGPGASRRALDAAASAGAEVRTIADPPAYFVTDGETGFSYPDAWAPDRPETVHTLYQGNGSGGFRHLFAYLWRRASTLPTITADLALLLRALDGGDSDEAVAERLGISDRTLRRRIQEAMEALGASNRFTLGAAWASHVDVAAAG